MTDSGTYNIVARLHNWSDNTTVVDIYLNAIGPVVRMTQTSALLVLGGTVQLPSYKQGPNI